MTWDSDILAAAYEALMAGELHTWTKAHYLDYGAAYKAVHRHAARHGLPVPPKRVGKLAGVDLARPTADIVAETGCTAQAIREAQRRAGLSPVPSPNIGRNQYTDRPKSPSITSTVIPRRVDTGATAPQRETEAAAVKAGAPERVQVGFRGFSVDARACGFDRMTFDPNRVPSERDYDRWINGRRGRESAGTD